MLLSYGLCTAARTIDSCKGLWLLNLVRADLRISITDYHKNKKLKVLLFRPAYPSRGFLVPMNGKPWPGRGEPVCLTRLLRTLRKALVRAEQPAATARALRTPTALIRAIQPQGRGVGNGEVAGEESHGEAA